MVLRPIPPGPFQNGLPDLSSNIHNRCLLALTKAFDSVYLTNIHRPFCSQHIRFASLPSPARHQTSTETGPLLLDHINGKGFRVLKPMNKAKDAHELAIINTAT